MKKAIIFLFIFTFKVTIYSQVKVVHNLKIADSIRSLSDNHNYYKSLSVLENHKDEVSWDFYTYAKYTNLISAEEYTELKHFIEPIINAYPDIDSFYHYRAISKFYLSDTAGALIDFYQTYHLKPKSIRNNLALAKIFFHLNQLDSFDYYINVCEKMMAVPNRQDLITKVKLDLYLYNNSTLKLAKKELDKWNRKKSNRYEYFRYLLTYYESTNNFTKQLEVADILVDSFPENVISSRCSRASLLINQSEYTSDLRESYKILEKAKVDLAYLLETDSTHEHALKNLATIFQIDGDYNLSDSILDIVETVFPVNSEIKLMKITNRIYSFENNDTTRLILRDFLIKKTINSDDINFLIGFTYLLDYQIDSAISFLEGIPNVNNYEDLIWPNHSDFDFYQSSFQDFIIDGPLDGDNLDHGRWLFLIGERKKAKKYLKLARKNAETQDQAQFWLKKWNL